MMALLSLLLAAVGFACLALAMGRHHRDVTGAAPAPVRRVMLRLAGIAALLGSVLASIAAWGPAQGVIGGFGVLAAGAGALVLWLSFRSPAKPTPRPSSHS